MVPGLPSQRDLLATKINAQNYAAAARALTGDYANAGPYMTTEIVSFHEAVHVRQHMQVAADAWKTVKLEDSRHHTETECAQAANKARREWSREFRSIIPQFGGFAPNNYEGPAWAATFPEMAGLASEINAQWEVRR